MRDGTCLNDSDASVDYPGPMIRDKFLGIFFFPFTIAEQIENPLRLSSGAEIDGFVLYRPVDGLNSFDAAGTRTNSDLLVTCTALSL